MCVETLASGFVTVKLLALIAFQCKFPGEERVPLYQRFPNQSSGLPIAWVRCSGTLDKQKFGFVQCEPRTGLGNANILISLIFILGDIHLYCGGWGR